jgi:hypothetical protein
MPSACKPVPPPCWPRCLALAVTAGRITDIAVDHEFAHLARQISRWGP